MPGESLFSATDATDAISAICAISETCKFSQMFLFLV